MKKYKKAVIIAGGYLEFDPRDLIDEDTIVIAADRGYDHAIKYGLIPNWVIGDFDSCFSSVLASVKKVVLSPNKDVTDLEAAIDLAYSNNIVELDILAAISGDRDDHGFGAIQSLLKISKRIPSARIISKDGKTEVRFVFGPTEIQLYGNKGDLFSLFSYSESVEKLCIEGAKYNLNNTNLTNDSALCISNEFQKNRVNISFSNGVLLCYLPIKKCPKALNDL